MLHPDLHRSTTHFAATEPPQIALHRAKQLSAQVNISANHAKAKKAKIGADALAKPVPVMSGLPGWEH